MRNTLMHSPDFSLSKEKRNECFENILNLAKDLKDHVPELLETIETEIKKVNAQRNNRIVL